jgi:RNA polymerase sigma factor (sigma-70 family)
MTTAHAGTLPERWDAVLEHRDRALRVARARLSDPYDVDDCVQEGMARVVAMPNLDRGRVGPLRSTVVANVAADTHRQQVRSLRLRAKVGWSEVPTPPGDEAVCDAAEARWLRTRLETLGERERAVVELRAKGRTVTETAAALGMTYKAVESAFTRGRAALKTLWRATLVTFGAAIMRTLRSSERAAGAAALAAALSFAIVVQVVPHKPAHHAPAAAPPMPTTSYQTTTAEPSSSAVGKARTGRRTVAPRHRDRGAQTLAVVRPPHTFAGPGRVRVTREHPEESLADTAQRCLRKGVTVRPDKIRCNG